MLVADTQNIKSNIRVGPSNARTSITKSVTVSPILYRLLSRQSGGGSMRQSGVIVHDVNMRQGSLDTNIR
jgi:hypothetical protein